MKGERAGHLSAYLLCACLLLSLLSGCGKNGNDRNDDGRGDIVEDQTPATVETINAEDFYGCWEYTDTDAWLYFYGDGTYERLTEDSVEESGAYYMEDGELCLEDSGLRFALDGEGGMVSSDGETLFLSELPEAFQEGRGDYFEPEPVAYFEERGYSFDLEMDEGRFPLENAARYYYSDGSYYTTVYAEWGLKKISDTVVSDQYREIVFRASCYFPHSSNPGLSGNYIVGCTSQLFDYYTGECLPMASIHGDSSAEENIYSYTLNINGEEVRIDYMKSVSWEEHVGDCRSIAHQTATVRMPVDYDGLVFCASPSPYTYEECMASDREGEGYFTGLALEERIGIDEDNALFCRIW